MIKRISRRWTAISIGAAALTPASVSRADAPAPRGEGYALFLHGLASDEAYARWDFRGGCRLYRWRRFVAIGQGNREALRVEGRSRRRGRYATASALSNPFYVNLR